MDRFGTLGLSKYFRNVAEYQSVSVGDQLGVPRSTVSESSRLGSPRSSETW